MPTRLFLACQNNDRDTALSEIRDHPENINPEETDNLGRQTSLIWACMNKMEKVALELIATGKSNPGHVDAMDCTALMWTCTKSMKRVALALLATGESNPGYDGGNYGNTALILACESGME